MWVSVTGLNRTRWPVVAGRLRSRHICKMPIAMCAGNRQCLKNTVTGENTSSAVSGKSEAFDEKTVSRTITDDVVQHSIRLLKLKGKLFVRRSSIASEHNSSLALTRDILHQRRMRSMTAADQRIYQRLTKVILLPAHNPPATM